MKGIDGTKNGWISAEFTGEEWKVDFHKKLSEIDFVEALIDIPIGLPEDKTRKCDKMARKFFKRKAPEAYKAFENDEVWKKASLSKRHTRKDIIERGGERQSGITDFI